MSDKLLADIKAELQRMLMGAPLDRDRVIALVERITGCREAKREDVLKAVNDEPELPGDMPEPMWKAICGDRDACAEAMRIAVRQTKAGIRKRIEQLYVPQPLQQEKP